MVNIFTNPRIRKVILFSVLIVSICGFLALETGVFEEVKIPTILHTLKPKITGQEEKETPKTPQYLDAGKVYGDREEKVAYATFLSGTEYSGDDLEEDKYFVAVRILVWQLKHVPETRTNRHDVIVIVTPSVSQSRRDRLRKDGAIVHPVELLHVENQSWIKNEIHRFEEVMAKLRVWEMTQYNRILM